MFVVRFGRFRCRKLQDGCPGLFSQLRSLEVRSVAVLAVLALPENRVMDADWSGDAGDAFEWCRMRGNASLLSLVLK